MPTLRVTVVKDAGDLERERLVIPVPTDCDIGLYMLVRARSTPKNLVGGDTTAYWFPNKEIKAGDRVVVYTKRGNYKEKITSGGKTHFFYWGKSEDQWGDTGYGAAVGIFADFSSWRPDGFDDDADLEPIDDSDLG